MVVNILSTAVALLETQMGVPSINFKSHKQTPAGVFDIYKISNGLTSH